MLFAARPATCRRIRLTACLSLALSPSIALAQSVSQPPSCQITVGDIPPIQNKKNAITYPQLSQQDCQDLQTTLSERHGAHPQVVDPDICELPDGVTVLNPQLSPEECAAMHGQRPS